jgi:hypothetical protein
MKDRLPAVLPALLSAILILTLTPLPAGAKVNRSESDQVRPSYSGFVPAKLRFKVSSALGLALNHLKENQSCRDLFSPFDSDGLSAVEGSIFEVARSRTDLSICRDRSAAAFTTVGGARTHLCAKHFDSLTVHRAAVILIHESLHQSGMTEWPFNPDALRSFEINNLIRSRCRL